MMLARATVTRLVTAARSSLSAQIVARGERRNVRSAAVAAALSRPDQAPPVRRGRPSKTAAKQEAKQFQDIARQLSRLTEKQLARLEPLVGEEVVDAVALAARISHRNQGRQRQEGLVAKLLRESVEDTEVAQLQAAIDSVRIGQGVIANPRVEQQVQLWMAALLAGDSLATTQVFGLAQSNGADMQQVRQLLRQAQQTEAVPVPESLTEDGSSSDEAAGGGGATVAAASSASRHDARPTPKALSARKQLRKLLQPLAEQAQQEAGSDEDE